MQAESRTTFIDLVIPWVVTLSISIFPDILFQELSHSIPSWLFWAKLGLLGVLVVLSYFLNPLRPLRQYFIIFIVFFAADRLMGWVTSTSQWKHWFGSTAFVKNMLGIQLEKLAVTSIMIIAVWIMQRQPGKFYLVAGQLDAPAKPVRWLGINRRVSWKKLGWISGLCISLGVLAFLVIFGHPALKTFLRLPVFIPAILLFAAMNAFSEEMTYRAPQLATLQNSVGSFQAILITAVFFGIAHYYGVPYGIVGVVMSGLLGWWLGKSMTETSGLFWPWFIHFLQDVMVFSFIALGSIVAGGG